MQRCLGGFLFLAARICWTRKSEFGTLPEHFNYSSRQVERRRIKKCARNQITYARSERASFEQHQFKNARALTRVSLVAAVLGALPTAATADTIYVPADQPTIQMAITAANNGDVILVSPGTYFEHIDYLGKAISIQSTNGPAQTVIDGSNSGTVVTFQTQENAQSVLTGFTIQHGSESFGAGIMLFAASATITKNIFRENAQGGGGFGGPELDWVSHVLR